MAGLNPVPPPEPPGSGPVGEGGTPGVAAVSYTHLDVYKRQVLSALAAKILNDLDPTTVMGTVEALSKVVITTLSPQDIICLLYTSSPT